MISIENRLRPGIPFYGETRKIMVSYLHAVLSRRVSILKKTLGEGNAVVVE